MLNPMRKLPFLLTALALFIGLQAREAHAQQQTVLNVPLLGQKTEMWCWAAGLDMAASYKGTLVAQCEQANHQFLRDDCCNNPTPQHCIQGGWPEFDRANFDWQQHQWGFALTFARLQQEFNARRPVPFAWGWVGGGGHIMVAIGYKSDATGNWVYINDPWPPNVGESRWITYEDFVAVWGRHFTQRNYYGLANRVLGKDVTIKSKRSSLVLGVAAGSTIEGEAIVQWPKDGTANQLWKLEPTEDGYVTIKNKGSALLLGVEAGSTAPGAAIIQWLADGTANQSWKLEPTRDGYYVIRNKGSGLVLNVEGNSPIQGAHIVQWKAEGADNEKWKIE
jgi:hypothetical protein